MTRRVKLRSGEKVTGRRDVVAYRRAATKRLSLRERLAGIDGKDAAAMWLRMSPAKRRELSDDDVRRLAAKPRKDRWPMP